MLFIVLFFIELLILFFLSRMITRGLSYLFYRITGSQKIMIYLMALFFFPGTFVHEMAHAVTSILLFVRVSHIEFVPKMIGSGVKMGSVQIASTDPVRRALIGMAPFFWGSSFILGILYAFLTFGGIENIWITILTGYVLFEISNTMFSSRKDMEGTLELLIGIGILGIVGYLLGFRFPQISPDPELTEMILSLFRTGTVFLTVPLIIDIVLLCILKGLRMLHN